jgi:hypothetical protein
MQFRPGARRLRMRLGIVVMISTVVACAPVPDRVQFTVEYYRDHPDKRNGMIASCVNDPGTHGNDPDCVNAREAARRMGVGTLKDLPPLGLPLNPKPPNER